MLVRAGHRCPTCFCLTSLCRCQRERVTLCLCSVPDGHTALFHHRHAHVSFFDFQAVDIFFRFRLVSLFISCTRTVACCLDRTPHGRSYPHPCQWQVLHRSYSRRQRRLSRHARERWPLPSAVTQCAIHSFCDWLLTRSVLATMNPHRPGGGPRQHYRPDGSRRRTAGELAKRAARAAARAADAAGGGAAKPAATVVADASTQAVTPVPKQVPISAAPTGELPASTSASTSSSTAAPALATTPGLAHGTYPSRMQHPPPSIAAGPKPGGDWQRTWMPALPHPISDWVD